MNPPKSSDTMQLSLPLDTGAKALRGIATPEARALEAADGHAFTVHCDPAEIGRDATPGPEAQTAPEPTRLYTLAEMQGFVRAVAEARRERPDIPRAAWVAAGRIARPEFNPSMRVDAARLLQWVAYMLKTSATVGA